MVCVFLPCGTRNDVCVCVGHVRKCGFGSCDFCNVKLFSGILSKYNDSSIGKHVKWIPLVLQNDDNQRILQTFWSRIHHSQGAKPRDASDKPQAERSCLNFWQDMLHISGEHHSLHVVCVSFDSLRTLSNNVRSKGNHSPCSYLQRFFLACRNFQKRLGNTNFRSGCRKTKCNQVFVGHCTSTIS